MEQKFYSQVKTLEQLNQIKQYRTDEYIYCEEDGKVYCWNESQELEPVKFDSKGIDMNLYEMNKMIIEQMSDIEFDELIRNKVKDFYTSTEEQKHYMLLCRDINYYTIFESVPQKAKPAAFAKEIKEIIEELGQLKSVDIEDNGNALAFWIMIEDKAYQFLLFPYEAGVVYFG